MLSAPVVVVGRGHSGPVAAWYPAKVGTRVVVELRRGFTSAEGGWEDQQDEFVDAMIAQVEARASGCTASLTDRHIRTPTFMAEELRRPGAKPMQLDISLDQLASMPPTRQPPRPTVLGVAGLCTCGASAAPVGGIAGSSGKDATRELLKAQS